MARQSLYPLQSTLDTCIELAILSRGLCRIFKLQTPILEVFPYFLCFWGPCKIFSSEIPLFLFSGVFLKLFLYRPLPRTIKQVTLDFRYPVTYFFRIDPFHTSNRLKIQRDGQFPRKNLLLHLQVLPI